MKWRYKMRKVTKLSGMTAIAALAGALLTPASVGAQTVQLCDGQPVTITGTAGDDVLTGTQGNDVIFAAQGNDIIWGRGGDDIICAGQGDDVLIGGQGFDVLFGAQGHDVLFAADGSSEADRADSRGARMFGGAGNDLLVGSNRWDRMQGGLGTDTLDGYEGRDWMRGGGDTDHLDGGANVDDMHGGNGHDRMRATTGDSVRGSNGNDACELRGEPELLVSCTENPAAYATARTMPISTPNDAGAAQVFDHVETKLNQRNISEFEEIYADCTDIATINNEAYLDYLTDQYGATWTINFTVFDGNLASLSGASVIVREELRANSSPEYETEFEIPVLYEDGAWRVASFC